MGLDLSLLIATQSPGRDTVDFAHTMIEIVPFKGLADGLFAIERRVGQPVPVQFHTYTSRVGGKDPHYGNTQQTPYGEPLQFVRARDLVALAKHPDVRGSTTNRAAWAYVGQMPEDTLVALYWR